MQRGVGMGRGGFVGAWHAVPGAAPEALSQKHGVTCGVLAWNGTTPPSTFAGHGMPCPYEEKASANGVTKILRDCDPGRANAFPGLPAVGALRGNGNEVLAGFEIKLRAGGRDSGNSADGFCGKRNRK